MKKLKNKKIGIFPSTKYKLGKSQKALKKALKDLGATKISLAHIEKYDYYLLGEKNYRIEAQYEKEKILFEDELSSKKDNHFQYFEGLKQKFFEMIKILISTKNIKIDVLEFGKGLTEKEFSSIEKKLKRKLPKTIKEFYSIFGYIKILWQFKKPSSKKRTYSSFFQIHDHHEGCINILPLRKFLFENWKDPEWNFILPEGRDIRLFDPYASYHIVGLDLAGDDDPFIFLGSDYGVDFQDLNGLTFSTYIKTVFGIYGYVNRFTDTCNWIIEGNGYLFNEYAVEDKEDKHNKIKSVEGFVNLDFSNKNGINEHIRRYQNLVNEAIERKEHDFSIKKMLESKLWEYDSSIYPTIKILIDLALEENIMQLELIELICRSKFWEHDSNIKEIVSKLIALLIQEQGIEYQEIIQLLNINSIEYIKYDPNTYFLVLLDWIATEDFSDSIYFEKLTNAVEEGLDLLTYEKETKYDKYFKTEEYQKIKNSYLKT